MKFIKGLFKFIFINILIILMAASFLLFMLINGKDDTLYSVRYSSVTAEEVLSREVNNALTAGDGESFNLTLSEMSLNEFGFKYLNGKGISFFKIRGFRAWYLGNGKIRVDVPVKAFIFKSVLSTTMRIVPQGDGVTFDVIKVKVGKIKLGKKFAKNVLGTIQKWFKLYPDLGDGLKLNVPELTASVKYSAIEQVVENFTSSGEQSFAPLLINMCLENNLVSVIAGDEFGIKLNLKNFLYNSARDGTYYNVDFNQVVSDVESNAPQLSYKNVNALFNYYTSGYDNLSDDDRETIDDMGLSASEEGVKQLEQISTSDFLMAQQPDIADAVSTRKVSFSISEEHLNKIVYNQTLVGTGYAFTNGTTASFIAVDGFYANIKQNYLELCFVISLNGTKVCIKTGFECLPSSSGGIRCAPDTISVGSVTLSQKLTDKFKSYIYEFSKGIDENWIEPVQDGSIILYVDRAVSNSGAMSVLLGMFSNVYHEERCETDRLVIEYNLN